LLPVCSARFKAITGCDRITAEIKYRDSFEFTPFARLLFSANRLSASSDASQAFFDRWLIVPFPKRFRHMRGELPRHILQARLCAPRELSGAPNKALDGLERVRRRCWFTESKESWIQVKRSRPQTTASQLGSTSRPLLLRMQKCPNPNCIGLYVRLPAILS
jgi:hypothetical protein